MSFWKEQPLSVNDKAVEQILTSEELLSKIQTANFKIEYKTFTEVTPEFRAEILEFLNANYVGRSENKLRYSPNLFEFYLNNSLLIQFHPKGKPEQIIGIIIGKRKTLVINSCEFKIIEVNFLCISPTLRNLHLAPFFISTLTKED